MKTAAIWARVSTAEQQNANQLGILRAWASKRDLEVVAEFATEDSAYQSGARGREFDASRAALTDGARLGNYDVVLIWSLDRLSRRGTEDTLATLRRLAEYDCDVWSHEESWLRTADPAMRELLIGIFAWIARQESARRSERARAAVQRRRDAGLPVGGIAGRHDLKPRRRSGYVARWEKTRA